MLSQFFMLSERGDTLIYRDYRGDIVSSAPDIFYRRIKSSKGNGGTPTFNVEGTQFVYIVQYGLYFVCTSIENVSPCFVLEFLQKISMLCKDYCGVVHEVGFYIISKHTDKHTCAFFIIKTVFQANI